MPKDTHRTARTDHAELQFPEQVSVAVAELAGLDLVALMVDGIRVAEHTWVVALGITLDGTKIRSLWPRGHREHQRGHRPAGRAG